MSEWYEQIIDDLEYDNCVLIVNSIGGVRIHLFKIENGEYTGCSADIFSKSISVNGKKCSVYDKYEDILFDTMCNNKAKHVFRYENNQLTDYRKFNREDYNLFVYDNCAYNLLLRNEFGLEPKSEEDKEFFKKELRKAERFKKSLVYACYINDTESIIERAKTASKAQLNRKFDYFGTPLSFCARYNNLEGFKAIAEMGADLTVTCAGGTVSPLREAIEHSPDIVLYVYDNFPDVFEKNFNNWKGNVYFCTDMRIYDLMFGLYGKNGMEKLMFGLIERKNITGLKYAVEHGADFIEYRDKYGKFNALEYAETWYKRDKEYNEVYEILKTAEKNL